MTKSQWHSSPDNRVQFAALLETPLMREALSVVQGLARCGPSGDDAMKLALTYKKCEGIQFAIDTLLSLAEVPPSANRKLPPQFSHYTPDNQ